MPPTARMSQLDDLLLELLLADLADAAKIQLILPGNVAGTDAGGHAGTSSGNSFTFHTSSGMSPRCPGWNAESCLTKTGTPACWHCWTMFVRHDISIGLRLPPDSPPTMSHIKGIEPVQRFS